MDNNVILIRHTHMPYGKHSASKAVRVLLHDAVVPLALSSWVLDETQYPFQLHPHKLYVSFSHSNQMIGCAIGNHPAIGLDIETRPISPAVAQRYFSPLENAALNHHQAIHLDDAAQLRTRLWMLKEAYIKASWQQQPTSLFIGLKTCMVSTLGINTLELSCNYWQFNDWHIHIDRQIPLAAIYQTNNS